jgi:two-component system cell cycle response regulator
MEEDWRGATTAPPTTRQARRALVVDDSPSARALAAEVLRRAGLEVDLAKSGEEAYAACQGTAYDVVVCDNVMGGVSGVQLCRLLRGSPRTAGLAFVLLTSSSDRRSRFWARHAGADAYVTKEQLQGALGPQVQLLLGGPRRPPRPNVAGDRAGALERLAELGDTLLFEAAVMREVKRLLDHGEDRRALAEATTQLCAELTDADVTALALEGLTPSATVRARRPLPAADDDALREALGLRAHVEVTLCEPERPGEPPHGALTAPVVLPIRAGGVHCGELRAYVERGRLAERDRRTLEVIALELGPIARTTFLVEESRRLAYVDALTGLFNRRYASERIEAEIERCRRHGGTFGVALFDLDHFKRVNDTHGHDVGDLVLQRAARCLRETARRSDIVARWGGEELLVLMPATSLDNAVRGAQRLKAAIALLPPVPSGPARVTTSVGVAGSRPGDDARSLLGRADAALYRAKAAGRNCVEQEDAAA